MLPAEGTGNNLPYSPIWGVATRGPACYKRRRDRIGILDKELN